MTDVQDIPGLRVDSPVYAVYDEGLEQNGAVVGFTGEFVDHSFRRRGRGFAEEGREKGGTTGAVGCSMGGHGVGRRKEGPGEGR